VVVPRVTKMEPRTRCRYSVLLLCQCRPEVQDEWGGRCIVVLIVFEVEGEEKEERGLENVGM
jgi:hypothetical protein